MSINHYENFPVASILLPRHLRQPVSHIYRFARSADDLADEGEAAQDQRLAALAVFSEALRQIEGGTLQTSGTQLASDLIPLFSDLDASIRTHRLSLDYFHDLLSAFSQDVVQTRYADFASLLDYCRRSANPVGRLMLQLYRAHTTENVRQADQICSALQLINFWQDVAIDLAKNRIYLPQDDLQRFGVSESSLFQYELSPQWRQLMRFQVERARTMMQAGAPLALRLPGRIGLELRLVVQGGLRILEKIEQIEYDVFHRRPQLKPLDWLVMLKRALTLSS